MKNVRFYCIALFCLFIVQLFVIGCAGTSAPSRFYTLHSLGDQKVTQNVPSSAHFLSIGISPVEIPDYLDRPQIVIKSGRNELKFAEFDRWAGSLRENIASVLAENLSLLLSTDRVFLHPWGPALDIDYSVMVNVLHLDSIPGEKVKLKALWM
ncbi:MAG: PqiC family protein, partial [Nitrospirota bacterium]|nr:PqiC family protein [Nitrospirota bacterium]